MTTELKSQNKSVLAGGNLLQIRAIDRLMRSNLVQKFVGNNRPVPRFLKKFGI